MCSGSVFRRRDDTERRPKSFGAGINTKVDSRKRNKGMTGRIKRKSNKSRGTTLKHHFLEQPGSLGIRTGLQPLL